MRISMNTALSGSGRVDDIKGHPQGEIRGQTKLVKTEMRRMLAQEPYEKKIQKVEQLLRLVRKFPRAPKESADKLDSKASEVARGREADQKV